MRFGGTCAFARPAPGLSETALRPAMPPISGGTARSEAMPLTCGHAIDGSSARPVFPCAVPRRVGLAEMRAASRRSRPGAAAG